MPTHLPGGSGIIASCCRPGGTPRQRRNTTRRRNSSRCRQRSEPGGVALGERLPVRLLWIAAAAVLAGYVLLFLLARRPVALRPVRLAWLLGTAVALRLVLLGCG